MGWCLTPKLAIVMNLCKGQTIYQHLYASGGKFNRSGPVFDLTRNVNIANQIAEVCSLGYIFVAPMHKSWIDTD